MSVAIKGLDKRWMIPVPYRFASNMTASMRQEVRDAMAHIEGRTQIRFVKRAKQPGFITFKRDEGILGDGQSSHIGYGGGEQTVLLNESGGVGLVIHEICHALGVYHEHQRPDRDQHITVKWSNIQQGAESNFNKLTEAQCVTYGPYDHGSIMHYHKNAFSNGQGDTILSDEPIGQMSGLSQGDIKLLRRIHPSNVHIHRIEGDGNIGEETHRYWWSDGWDIARFYRVLHQRYGFFLKTSSGIIHIHRIHADGRVGERIDTRDWSGGWTTAEVFTVGPFTYLFLLKESSGRVVIHSIEADGRIGPVKHKYDWSSGWSSVTFYEVWGSKFAMLLKRSTGAVHVHRVELNGRIGERIQTHEVGAGFTTVKHFSQGAMNYMFMLKRGNGKMRVREVQWDGKLGGIQHSATWSSGWSSACIYEKWFNKYLFLLKASNGRAMVHKLLGNGGIGPVVTEREWSQGWTTAEVIENDLLFLLKKSGPLTVI